MPCVYLLASAFCGTLYLGVTSNLIGRIIQHREGAFDGFTKQHGIYRLVWFEMTGTMADAIASEKRIKRWRRDWKIARIERGNPHWGDLAISLGLAPLPSPEASGARMDAPRLKAGVTDRFEAS